ncbi:hypothetical protein AVEN_93078-1 [Araneus ventricosus]|uniref:Uncharacterized protein n=1 Tax=Araneus ventricosus TaxID=182803 RepID=A0A4Y2J678_ARAVE|nr:hypothetical protein AVEN_93078-1 [Araneus ventricosus]
MYSDNHGNSEHTPTLVVISMQDSAPPRFRLEEQQYLNDTLHLLTQGLDILTSRFEVTRGLFWDGPRNFEPRSDDDDDTLAGTPSPNFRIIPTGGRLAPTYDLKCKPSGMKSRP